MMKKPDPERIVVGSRALEDVMKLAVRVAPADCTILITGESGTGKELVARTVHQASGKPSDIFVPLNVAAIPENLLESYLFGHERGSFTGAEKARDGVFRSAQRGTLFLDEIGELPINIQPKLLRALEQKEILPVGSDCPINVDTRVIVATDRDIHQMVEDGSFREDLFYRLNVVNIHIPPLRERTEEIPALIEFYMARWCKEFNRPELGIDDEAKAHLLAHDWPGNVRELAHALERAVLLCEGDELSLIDLPIELQQLETPNELDLNLAVSEFKRRHIVNVLESVEYHREHAAQRLGISAATLYRYLDNFDLQGLGQHVNTPRAQHSHS